MNQIKSDQDQVKRQTQLWNYLIDKLFENFNKIIVISGKQFRILCQGKERIKALLPELPFLLFNLYKINILEIKKKINRSLKTKKRITNNTPGHHLSKINRISPYIHLNIKGEKLISWILDIFADLDLEIQLKIYSESGSLAPLWR